MLRKTFVSTLCNHHNCEREKFLNCLCHQGLANCEKGNLINLHATWSCRLHTHTQKKKTEHSETMACNQDLCSRSPPTYATSGNSSTYTAFLHGPNPKGAPRLVPEGLHALALLLAEHAKFHKPAIAPAAGTEARMQKLLGQG